MEQSAQIIAAVFLFLIGASHIAAPRAWVDLIVLLRSKGGLGSLLVGVLSLPMGVLVVGFHNVWHGPQALLTAGCFTPWSGARRAYDPSRWPQRSASAHAWLGRGRS